MQKDGNDTDEKPHLLYVDENVSEIKEAYMEECTERV